MQGESDVPAVANRRSIGDCRADFTSSTAADRRQNQYLSGMENVCIATYFFTSLLVLRHCPFVKVYPFAQVVEHDLYGIQG